LPVAGISAQVDQGKVSDLSLVTTQGVGTPQKSSRITRMMLRRSAYLLVLLLTACQPAFLAAPNPTATSLPGQPSQSAPTSSPTPQPSLTSSPTETLLPSGTPEPSATFTPSLTPLPVALGLDPADWEHWPVIPIVPERARQIYLIGQRLGNDPHAFSVFGDCQSEPKVFMGVYETDPAAVSVS